jgi:DNA polymerase-3 subunit delta
MPSVKKQDIKPIRQGGQVYVIAGKDEFLAAGQVTSLVGQLLKPEELAMCLWRAEADKVSAAEVFDELRTLPFLAERRVVVLTDADEFVSNNRQLLEKYFESPSASGVLVLAVRTWQSNTRLAKSLPKVGQLIEIGELKSNSLISYIRNYAREQHNKELSYNAAQMLIELAGDEPGVLCREIDKLAAYTNSTKVIAEKDIAAIVGRNRIFGAFEVIDSMTAGNTGKALEKLRMMFAGDKDAEYTTVGAFAWHFRRMFSASAMLAEGQSPEMVARKFRIWNSDEFFRTLRKMPLEKIGGCLKQLAEIDYDIKTGRATAETAIEAMVVQLANTDRH